MVTSNSSFVKVINDNSAVTLQSGTIAYVSISPHIRDKIVIILDSKRDKESYAFWYLVSTGEQTRWIGWSLVRYYYVGDQND